MDENSKFFHLKVERETFLIILNKSRKAEELTDVKLRMGDKLFPAHRNVLFHSSPVLKALISDQWSTTGICLISDEYVDIEIMEDLLSFFYTGSIKLTSDNVHAVCVAAHFLQIPNLLEPSVKYLCQFLTIENVLTLFQFSITCELEELNYSCLRFVNNNHESVFRSSEILEYSFKNFKYLTVGLKKFWNKMLRENTFDCIVRWTEKNLPERLTKLPVLLKNIPLEELPLKFLSETVSVHPLVKDSISGIETVSDAMANYRTYSTYSTPLWKTNQNMIVLGGLENTRALRLYDSRYKLWKQLPDMPSERTNFGVAVVNHRDIILCGGYLNNWKTSSVKKFDWTSQTWTDMPGMPLTCSNASAAICNDHLYVVGHFNDESNLKNALRYSFETKQWEYVASTNEDRGGGSLIEHKNHLYAFGGASKTIEKYDPAHDKWTIMTELLDNSVGSVAIHEHRVYINCYSGLQVYHPETNSLDCIPSSFLGSTQLVSLNGKLLAVGSRPQAIACNNSDLIHEFDLTTRKWIEFGKVDSKLCYHSAVVGAFH